MVQARGWSVATGKSGADAGSVFASGGQAAVSAPCAWRLGGQGTGRLEDSPHDDRSGGTRTVPAAALFVLPGDSPRTR